MNPGVSCATLLHVNTMSCATMVLKKCPLNLILSRKSWRMSRLSTLKTSLSPDQLKLLHCMLKLMSPERGPAANLTQQKIAKRMKLIQEKAEAKAAADLKKRKGSKKSQKEDGEL